MMFNDHTNITITYVPIADFSVLKSKEWKIYFLSEKFIISFKFELLPVEWMQKFYSSAGSI